MMYRAHTGLMTCSFDAAIALTQCTASPVVLGVKRSQGRELVIEPAIKEVEHVLAAVDRTETAAGRASILNRCGEALLEAACIPLPFHDNCWTLASCTASNDALLD